MARDPALPILSAFPYEDVSKLSSSEKEEAGRDLRNATLSENKEKLKCRIWIGAIFYYIGPETGFNVHVMTRNNGPKQETKK